MEVRYENNFKKTSSAKLIYVELKRSAEKEQPYVTLKVVAEANLRGEVLRAKNVTGLSE